MVWFKYLCWSLLKLYTILGGSRGLNCTINACNSYQSYIYWALSPMPVQHLPAEKHTVKCSVLTEVLPLLQVNTIQKHKI